MRERASFTTPAAHRTNRLCRAGWVLPVTLALQAACGGVAEPERAAGNAPMSDPADASPADTDREIARLVASTAELEERIRRVETVRGKLAAALARHQSTSEKLLDDLMQELTQGPEAAAEPGRTLDTVAYEADEAFKRRAREALESALERDLAMQRELESVEADLGELRVTLDGKQAALEALLNPPADDEAPAG